MHFVENYTDLLKYAKTLCRNANLCIEAGDLVNDAYIELHENKNATKNDYIKRIKSLYERAKGLKAASYVVLDTTRVCKICHEEKPANAFYSVSTGLTQLKNKLSYYCIECYRKRNNEYNKQPTRQEKNKQAVAKYVSENRAAYNAYQRQRYKLYGRKDRGKGVK